MCASVSRTDGKLPPSCRPNSSAFKADTGSRVRSLAHRLYAKSFEISCGVRDILLPSAARNHAPGSPMTVLEGARRAGPQDNPPCDEQFGGARVPIRSGDGLVHGAPRPVGLLPVALLGPRDGPPRRRRLRRAVARPGRLCPRAGAGRCSPGLHGAGAAPAGGRYPGPVAAAGGPDRALELSPSLGPDDPPPVSPVDRTDAHSPQPGLRFRVAPPGPRIGTLPLRGGGARRGP